MAAVTSDSDEAEPFDDAEALIRLQDWKRSGRADLLADAARSSKNPGERWFATRYLQDFSDKRTVDTLAALLADDYQPVRRRAARSLREIGPAASRAVPALREALFDDDGPLRISAARALGAIGDKSAIPDLVRLAETTAWDALHSWVTESLTLLGAPEAENHLLRRLDAEKTWQRRWAAKQLGAIGGEASLAPLRQARSRDLLHRRVYTRATRDIETRLSEAVKDAV